jgi:hypothetical protein
MGKVLLGSPRAAHQRAAPPAGLSTWEPVDWYRLQGAAGESTSRAFVVINDSAKRVEASVPAEDFLDHHLVGHIIMLCTPPVTASITSITASPRPRADRRPPQLSSSRGGDNFPDTWGYRG